MWENSNPNNEYPASSINLNYAITNFKYIVIEAKITNSSGYNSQFFKFRSNQAECVVGIPSGSNLRGRSFSFSSQSCDISNGEMGGTATPGAVIPMAIYGTNIL